MTGKTRLTSSYTLGDHMCMAVCRYVSGDALLGLTNLRTSFRILRVCRHEASRRYVCVYARLGRSAG
jgi:hypothetical protein